MLENQKKFISKLRYINEERLAKIESNPSCIESLLSPEDFERYCWLETPAAQKKFKIEVKKIHARGDREDTSKPVEGTLEEILDYFGYTLLLARESGIKINRYPKTIKSLVSTLEKAFDYKEGRCYTRTSFSIVK